jgi:hypothetical protein
MSRKTMKQSAGELDDYMEKDDDSDIFGTRWGDPLRDEEEEEER